MNPRHYLAHVLLAHHPPKREPEELASVVKEHFRKATSVEAVTQSLRDRLARKRQREAMQAELTKLERELAVIGEVQDERVDRLRKKVQELKKKTGPIGP